MVTRLGIRERLPHGGITQIAKVLEISRQTVENVLYDRNSASAQMRIKVISTARVIITQHEALLKALSEDRNQND